MTLNEGLGSLIFYQTFSYFGKQNIKLKIMMYCLNFLYLVFYFFCINLKRNFLFALAINFIIA